MAKPLQWTLLLIVGLVLAGCYDEGETVLHEPGEYKGKEDPLLSTNASARAEQLKARFQGVQTDR